VVGSLLLVLLVVDIAGYPFKPLKKSVRVGASQRPPSVVSSSGTLD
jgi:hypothetical protein